MTRFLCMTAAILAVALVPVEAQAKRKPLCTNSYQEIKGKCESGGNRDKSQAPVRSRGTDAPRPNSGSSGNNET